MPGLAQSLKSLVPLSRLKGVSSGMRLPGPIPDPGTVLISWDDTTGNNSLIQWDDKNGNPQYLEWDI